MMLMEEALKLCPHQQPLLIAASSARPTTFRVVNDLDDDLRLSFLVFWGIFCFGFFFVWLLFVPFVFFFGLVAFWFV